MGFNDAHLFAQHINSLHSLPVFEPEYQTKDATAETAFNGALQFHEIMNNAACRVLESFMLNQRSAIATLIKQRLSQEPQKVQFTVKLQFLKLHQDESSTELGESIKIFALSYDAHLRWGSHGWVVLRWQELSYWQNIPINITRERSPTCGKFLNTNGILANESLWEPRWCDN